MDAFAPQGRLWSSVKTRVTLFTLAVFLLILWTLSFYVGTVTRQSVQEQAMEQQQSIAKLVATSINDQLQERFIALQAVADSLTQRQLTAPEDVQRVLQEDPALQTMFNGGSFMTGVDAVARASLPLSAKREGVSYADRDYIQNALAGRAFVGKPVMGRQIKAPIVGLAVPIRAQDGAIVGALAGIINLGESSFLDKIVKTRYAETGGYLVVARQHRLVVTATDKRRVMTAAALPGVSPLIDRFLDGYEGAGLTVNSLGEEVLAAAQSIPTANWFLAVSLPAQEAFAMVDAVQQRMLYATLLLTLLAAGLTWVVLQRQFAPLVSASRSLQAQLKNQGPIEPLPVQTQDEIGELITGFNRMLSLVGERESELARSQAFALMVANNIPGQFAYWSRDLHCVFANNNFLSWYGKTAQEIQGIPMQELVSKETLELAAPFIAGVLVGENQQFEREVVRFDGSVMHALVQYRPHISEHQVLGFFVLLTDISERKLAEDEIRNLAFYDPLTGLPNRRLLMDRLGQALTAAARRKRSGALLFLDLDNFKDLNDTLGHDTGDHLLQQVAHRLLTCVREGDTVARLGGDEFVVMLHDLHGSGLTAAQEAERVGRKVLDTLNQPYLIQNTAYRSTPSIGITLFGDRQEALEDLLKRADLAMYQAKAAGRNTLRFFDAEMQIAVSRRAELESALREAVVQQQFLLHFQPQVDSSGAVHGAEVLLRWMHPQRGMVSPAEFIPLAESTGVILPLGQWVLEEACAHLARWATIPALQHLSLAVNVSARQLVQPDFVAQVLHAVQAAGCDPQRLKLELTESVLVSDVDNTIAKMRALRDQGIRFSMDDFGTGYSSLAFLKRLPLDQLKIDQGFVRDILVDPNDAAIAKMVIALANSMGLSVIAEGVETLEQRDFLAAHGCFDYQGYLFGRPVPLQEFEAGLENSAQ